MSTPKLWTRRGAVMSAAGVGAPLACASLSAVPAQAAVTGLSFPLSRTVSEFLNAGDRGDQGLQISTLDRDAQLVVGIAADQQIESRGASEIVARWSRARGGRAMSHMLTSISLHEDRPAPEGECFIVENIYSADRRLLLGQAHYRLQFSATRHDRSHLLSQLRAEILWSTGQSMNWITDVIE